MAKTHIIYFYSCVQFSIAGSINTVFKVGREVKKPTLRAKLMAMSATS